MNRRELVISKRVRTINGYTVIQHYYDANIFGINQRFYEISNLETDVLIGYNFLKKSNSKLDFNKGTITCGKFCENFLHFQRDCDIKENVVKKEAKGKEINVLNENIKDTEDSCLNEIIYEESIQGNDKSVLTQNVSHELKALERLRKNIQERVSKLHSKINLNLPFRTDIKAEIKTIDNEPVWSKQYPYPLSANSFVNKEIEKLLKAGIIRESRGPYNSPVWVVPKKGINDDGTQKLRLVIDYKKLNAKTIAYKYPIPDCNVILSNLGKSKYFSTIDLESGFHQILMKKDDIGKTAFSVNNGKYEFVRLPFGLKNAPSIFQNAMDDILRKFIGKFCHVYIDDIIVYSETLNEHIEHLEIVIDTLREANMKISLEKSRFFETQVEFLGYVVAFGVIKTDPNKIDTIRDYPLPKTLRQLRSFLGMIGYYRKFIRDYAKIAKPLTKHLSGKNGRVSQYMSKKTEIDLNEEGVLAFEKLKRSLFEQIELTQPDFNKKFILTTDASNEALGAVLSQEGKPITFISKTLNATERNYATNEKELYAIVWAIKTLRNYLYGVADLEIHTDHQPLTFAISTKNPNAKIKRWMSFVEEYSPKFVYKPGTTNVVADALSRQILNNITDNESLESTQHSAESSETIDIPETAKPLNEFKEQILLHKTGFSKYDSLVIFDKTRHIIDFDTRETLKTILFRILKPNFVTAIHCNAEDLYEFKETIKGLFTNRFIYTRIFAIDITSPDDQLAIIEQTHTRAHRNCKENYKQIFQQYYWPKMLNSIKQYVRHCSICNKTKYDRRPNKLPIGEAPIPNNEGEFLHIDIFYAQNHKFITCVDAYSKYLVIGHIEDKLNLGEKVQEILQSFPNAKKLTLDNEPGFTTPQFRSLMQRMNIELYFCDPRHSSTNGQVERVHSTLVEIARCIKEEYCLIDIKEIFYKAAKQYNLTIHSVTNKKPYDVFHNKIKHDDVRDKLRQAQLKILNRNRPTKIKIYEPNQEVYEKLIGKRNKLDDRYKKQRVQLDLGNKVKIFSRNRIINKENIKS